MAELLESSASAQRAGVVEGGAHRSGGEPGMMAYYPCGLLALHPPRGGKGAATAEEKYGTRAHSEPPRVASSLAPVLSIHPALSSLSPLAASLLRARSLLLCHRWKQAAAAFRPLLDRL